MEEANLGKIVLFGSGETTATGRAIHDRLMAELAPPITVAILETPAGFQPNSQHVASEVGDFFLARLRNYHPQVHIIPARKKEGPFTPDDPRILEPLLAANYMFLGPGSPTYTVRNLKGTLALKYILGRHQEGAALCFASAAALAVGARVLPVYEIFKAGADLYWVDGLNIFAPFGLELAIVPHWNNTEGGAHLDTSRCFMGRERMEELRQLLPPTTVLLGIDEHTALIFDFQRGQGMVMGKGGVTYDAGTGETVRSAGDTFALDALGPYRLPSTRVPTGLPAKRPAREAPAATPALPLAAAHLISLREEARRSRDWARADALRQQLDAMGLEIRDTPAGLRWLYKGEKGDGRPVF